MNEEITVVDQPKDLVVPRNGELEVSATTPIEMSNANVALIQWCDQKIASMMAEAAELKEAFEHAVARKWKSGTLKKHAKLAAKRVVFYVKVKAALDEGFYIVPNFPVNLFAIRTDRKKPLKILRTDWGKNWFSTPSKKQCAEQLPVGEGEYKNPFPEVSDKIVATDPQHGNFHKTEAVDWNDMEFPLSMSKPIIMEATSRAMALKIFDEFGILEQKKSGDPLIVGRMIDPRSTSKLWPRHLTFIVAWHLNTKTI